jgi:hypothetical protein
MNLCAVCADITQLGILGSSFATQRRQAIMFRLAVLCVSRGSRNCAGSVLECHADKIALPPNHAAFVDGVEIIKRQFEVRGQDVKLLQLNSRATVRDVMDPAGEYAALRIKE